MTAAARERGVVVAHVPDPEDHASAHERITLLDFARRLAQLRGEDMAGMYEPQRTYPGPLYFVPSSTLTSEQADALGIRGPRDLFGGVVPHALVGTKAISHPLVAPDAASAPGWCAAFADHADDAVLDGHVAFDAGDALRAGDAFRGDALPAAARAKFPAEVVPGSIGHPDVQQCDVDIARLQVPLGRLAAAVRGHAETGASQQGREDLAVVVMIFNQQDASRGGRHGFSCPLKQTQANLAPRRIGRSAG
jgi:hypothetical protein